jgi:hypothetical protein
MYPCVSHKCRLRCETNDTPRLSQDQTLRLIGSREDLGALAALQSRLHWFETEVLSKTRT